MINLLNRHLIRPEKMNKKLENKEAPCSESAYSWTGSTWDICQMLRVLGIDITCFQDFAMILHGFVARSSRSTFQYKCNEIRFPHEIKISAGKTTISRHIFIIPSFQFPICACLACQFSSLAGRLSISDSGRNPSHRVQS